MKKEIDYSIEEARKLNHNYVGTEHLLLGLLREEDGVAAQVLMNLGLALEDVREEIRCLLGHNLIGASGNSGLERVARRMGSGVCKVCAILGILVGGLVATLAGALIGGQCLGKDPMWGGAIVAGVAYVIGVAFASRSSSKRPPRQGDAEA